MSENPFTEGQRVVCISESFLVAITTETNRSIIGTHPNTHPVEGEVLTIDEILGLYLRFDKYDNEAYNWWHHTRFAPVNEMLQDEQIEELVSIATLTP